MTRVHRIVRRCFTAWAVTILVCATGVQVARHRDADRARHNLTRFAPVVPTGLRAPHLQAAAVLRSMVAADIDHDGDVDVIGIDGALDLVVWLNDGTGQLVPRAMERSHGVRADPPGPTVDDQLTSSEPVTPSDPASARPARRIDPVALEASRASAVSSIEVLRREFVSSRTPRAPPSSITVSLA